jgi:hypothetical protein
MTCTRTYEQPISKDTVTAVRCSSTNQRFVLVVGREFLAGVAENRWCERSYGGDYLEK